MSTEKLREVVGVCLGIAAALVAAELGVSSVYAGPRCYARPTTPWPTSRGATRTR